MEKYGGPTAEALVESALYHASLLEKFDFTDIVLSMKSSDLSTMIQAYRLAHERCGYPLHVGVTEAGTSRMGLIKSAIGIGSLLHDGIGDTIRVSLTADPVEEVAAGLDILRALGLRGGPKLVSLPHLWAHEDRSNRAGRAKWKKRWRPVKKDITVAVMGCVVNAPGEAKKPTSALPVGRAKGCCSAKGSLCAKCRKTSCSMP